MAVVPLQTFEIPRPPIEAPLHGLIDTAYIVDLSDLPEEDQDRWHAGVSFYPNPVSCDHVTPWMSGTDDPQNKAEPGASIASTSFYSFVLTYSTACNAVPGKAMKANEDAAIDALLVGTGQAVEAILWGPGSAGPLADNYPPTGDNFSLSGSTPLVTGYTAGSCNGILNQNPTSGSITAMSPKQGQLALSQALGNCALGARGFLHAPVYLAEDWAGQDLARLSDPKDPESKLITNVRGDYIVGGSGYSGAGPVGHPLATPADGFAWAYASGPVQMLLSEPTIRDTTHVDHRNNLHSIIAERTVAIAVNSICLFAVYVDVA